MGLRLEIERFDQTRRVEVLEARAHKSRSGHVLHARLHPVARARERHVLDGWRNDVFAINFVTFAAENSTSDRIGQVAFAMGEDWWLGQ